MKTNTNTNSNSNTPLPFELKRNIDCYVGTNYIGNLYIAQKLLRNIELRFNILSPSFPYCNLICVKVSKRCNAYPAAKAPSGELRICWPVLEFATIADFKAVKKQAIKKETHN